MNVEKQTVVRVAIAGVAVLNGALACAGITNNVFQLDETLAGSIYDGVSALVAVASSAWLAWKNNSFTRPAVTADNVMALLKDGYELTDAIKEVQGGAGE